MTTITFKARTISQINHILDFAKREKFKVIVNDNDDEYLLREMQESEKSGEGNLDKVMEFLMA